MMAPAPTAMQLIIGRECPLTALIEEDQRTESKTEKNNHELFMHLRLEWLYEVREGR